MAMAMAINETNGKSFRLMSASSPASPSIRPCDPNLAIYVPIRLPVARGSAPFSRAIGRARGKRQEARTRGKSAHSTKFDLGRFSLAPFVIFALYRHTFLTFELALYSARAFHFHFHDPNADPSLPLQKFQKKKKPSKKPSQVTSHTQGCRDAAMQ